LQIALCSASDVEYQILLAHDLGLFAGETHRSLAKRCTEVKRMPTAFSFGS
jgi:four helix bundle protein